MMMTTELVRLFDLDRGAEAGDAAGDANAAAEVRSYLVRGKVWIIGPVTFKVFNNLTNDSLLAAEGYIRKISKMLKKPAHFGEAAQVVALVVGRNADRQHRAPMALTPLIIIRWGPDASSDRLRASVRCSVCGCKGADLQHASWGGSSTGWAPYPGQRQPTQ